MAYDPNFDNKSDETKGESPYWCWTLHNTNNVGPDEPRVYERSYPDRLSTYANLGGRGKSELKVLYTVAQEEMCPTSGVVHLQGYVEFDRRVKMSTLKNIFSKRIHWEKRRGNSQQARDYCSKEDTRVPDGLRWELGNRSITTGPGQRTDLLELEKDIKAGKKRKELAESHGVAFMKYHKGIEALADALDLSLEEKQPTYITRTNYILFGASGSGKSTWAEWMMDGDSVYRPQKNNSSMYSFETYKGEKWLFFDDFEPKYISNGTLKEIMDNRRCTLPGRGSNSSKIGRHTGVIITSNIAPDEWYDKATDNYKVNWQALQRRCKVIWECGSLESGDPTEDWTSLGGQKSEGPNAEYPKGYKLKSPLPDLIEWAKTKQAEEEAAAATAVSASSSAGPQSSSAAAAASASADSLDASVEYSDLPQASQSQGTQDDPITL